MSDDQDWIAHHMTQIDALVAEFGWAVQGVPATSSAPSLAYTVGLVDDGKPECVIVGLPLEVAQLIINDVAKLLPLADGTVVQDVANLPLRVDRMHGSQVERLLPAANLRAGAPVDAVQLVWPDKGGHYPDEEGFDAEMARFQPLLREPRVSARPTDTSSESVDASEPDADGPVPSTPRADEVGIDPSATRRSV